MDNRADKMENRDRVLEMLYELGHPRGIALNTTLQGGLGIEGVDAEELIEQVTKKFGTDFSSMEFDRYFVDEFSVSWGMLLMPIAPLLWGIMALTQTGTKTDITVQDLVDAVTRGHWEHPNRAPVYPWQRSKIVQ